MKKIGLLKRLLVILYDALLLAGVMFVSSIVFLILPASFETSLGGTVVKQLYLLGIAFFFYGWFWTHGGQTLGMRAWNLYLIKADGKFIDWPTAALRFFVAIISWAAAGLGFTWILLNKQRRSWHDLATGTEIVYLPKQQQPTIEKQP